MKIIKKQTYSPTEDENVNLYVSDFSQESTHYFMRCLLHLEADPLLTDIFVYVTSDGGDVSGLVAMIDTIKGCSKNVHLVSVGHNYSAAGLLVMTGPSGNRWMAPNGLLHIHEVQSIAGGATADIKRHAQHLDVIQDKLFDLLIQNSVLSHRSLKNRLKENDGEWLIGPEEALELRLIDRIGLPKIKVSTIWELEN